MWKSYQTALEAKKWSKAEVTLKDFENRLDEELRPSFAPFKLELPLKRGDLPQQAERETEATAAREPEDATYHTGLAWTLATSKDLQPVC